MNSLKSSSLLFACSLALCATPAFAIEAEKKLDRLDRNDDGRISRSEHADRAERIFAKMDADGNNVVTLAELKEWKDDDHDDKDDVKRKNRHKRAFASDQSPTDKFRALDQNGDGRLTAAEHADACKKRFEKIDKNNDGTLTESELEEAMD
jgi:hypothetical protein